MNAPAGAAVRRWRSGSIPPHNKTKPVRRTFGDIMTTWKWHAATLILTSTVALPALADDPAMCNAALSYGIRDNYSLLTEREQFEQYQTRLCDAEYSNYEQFRERSNSMGLDSLTAGNLFMLDASSSSSNKEFQEKYQRFCQATYFDANYSNRFYAYSSRVSDALTQSWLECHKTKTDAFLTLNKKGIYIDVLPQDDGFAEFTITATRRTPRTDALVINDIHPVGSIECVRKGKPVVTGTKVALNEFSFSCWKPPYKAVSVKLSTSDGDSNSVRVPSHTSKVAELNDRITRENRELRTVLNQIEGNLANAQNRLSKVAAGGTPIAQPMAGSGAKTWKATSECPAGHYVSAVVGYDRNGGDPCHNCMTNFSVVCMPIVAE